MATPTRPGSLTGTPNEDLVALSRRPHDRVGHRRNDEDWLARAWSDPTTRVLVIAGTRVRRCGGRLEWVAPAEAPEGTRVLLGERDAVVHFALVADASLAGAGWLALRQLMGSVDDQEAVLVVHAVGIAEWLWATRFCPRCGAGLRPEQAGHVLRCTACDRTQFPRVDPAVIMVVTHGDPPDDRCLLGRQRVWPEGRYSTLAGFVEPGESMEQAVRREVFEEVGVVVDRVDYFGDQPWPLPQSLMVGFVARAVTTEITVDGEEIEAARWLSREEMRAGAESGDLVLPGGISISRSLVEWWYGAPLPGQW